MPIFCRSQHILLHWKEKYYYYSRSAHFPASYVGRYLEEMLGGMRQMQCSGARHWRTSLAQVNLVGERRSF